MNRDDIDIDIEAGIPSKATKRHLWTSKLRKGIFRFFKSAVQLRPAPYRAIAFLIAFHVVFGLIAHLSFDDSLPPAPLSLLSSILGLASIRPFLVPFAAATDFSVIYFSLPESVFLVPVGLPLTVGIRTLLGFCFGRAIGWTLPSLFFNGAIHESPIGLAPVLTLVIFFVSFRNGWPPLSPVVLLLASSLASGNSSFWWWPFSALCSAFLLHVLSGWKAKLLLRAIRTLSVFAVGLLLVSGALASLSQWRRSVRSWTLEKVAKEDTIVHFIVMSAPRGKTSAGSILLEETIRSFESTMFPRERFSATVFTTFSKEVHPAFFDLARNSSLSFVKGDRGGWTGPPSTTSQALDIQAALSWAEATLLGNSSKSPRFVALMEDDFVWCPGAWRELRSMISELGDDSRFCGIFIATGGK